METIKNLLPIVLSSSCVYLFIIFALRIFGKKDLAQLSALDVVFILLISNAVQNAMVGSDTTLLGGITAATTLFIINSCFKKLTSKIPKLKEILEGHPVMLIYEGKALKDNLKKTGITMDELEEAIREHGVSSIEEINLGVLETDGNISIISNNYKDKSHKKRKFKNVLRKDI